MDLLEKFHSLGYLHCDVKTDNILIGIDNINSIENKLLYLIDFGISRKFLNENNEHIKEGKVEKF